MRPGLVFLTGGGGDMGMAGADGNGAEAGQMAAGQTGAGGDGVNGTGGTLGFGGGDDPGHGGVGGTAGIGGVAGAAAGAGNGGHGGAPSAGSSGAGGGSGGHLPAGRCPDIDDNFVYDCDETIAQNAAFDDDASDWDAEANLVVAWQTLDALADSDSGSLGLKDTFTSDVDGTLMLGASQCIVVDAETPYEFGVQISVPDGAVGTSAGFQLIVYDQDDCTGSKVDIHSSQVVSGSSWSSLLEPYTTVADAKSLTLRLVTVKPFRETPSSVLFDNVLVHTVE